MLVAIRRVVGDASEIDLWDHLASRDRRVAVTSQRKHANLARFEHPDLAHTQASIHLELIDRTAGDDDLDRDVGDVPICAAAVAFVRLEPPLLFLFAECRRAVAEERDIALEAEKLKQASDSRLFDFVFARGAHDLQQSLEVGHPRAGTRDGVPKNDIRCPGNVTQQNPLLFQRKPFAHGRVGRCSSHPW